VGLFSGMYSAWKLSNSVDMEFLPGGLGNLLLQLGESRSFHSIRGVSSPPVTFRGRLKQRDNKLVW